MSVTRAFQSHAGLEEYTYKVTDEVAVGLSGCSSDLTSRSVRLAVGNVLRDGPREEDWFLANDTYLAS